MLYPGVICCLKSSIHRFPHFVGFFISLGLQNFLPIITREIVFCVYMNQQHPPTLFRFFSVAMDAAFYRYLLKMPSCLNHICSLNCACKFGFWVKNKKRQIELKNVVAFFPWLKLFGKCNMNPLIALAALEMSFYLQWISSLPNVYPHCTSDILLMLIIFIKCYRKNRAGTICFGFCLFVLLCVWCYFGVFCFVFFSIRNKR